MTPDLSPDGHTVSQETLDRLAELDAAATPGPWALDGPWWWESEHCTTVVTDAQRLAVCIEPPPPSDPTLARANVALIVAMRNALPALIALARAAQANIAAAHNNPQPLLDGLDAWAEADPEHREVAISFPHETGKGYCVTITTVEQPDWTEWLTRKRQFFGPTLTAAIQAALDAARSTTEEAT